MNMNLEPVQLRQPRWPAFTSGAVLKLRTFRINTLPQYVWCTVFTALGGFLWGAWFHFPLQVESR
jgi:hypothetical protein